MKLLLVLVFIVVAGAVWYLISRGSKTVVTRVRDGDTFETSDGKVSRLYGMDAPEHYQPYGQEAKQALQLIAGKIMTVKPKDTDRYGRTVARVYFNGIDVSKTLIEAGCAWHYAQYDQSPDYQQAEQEAKALRRGLWADPAPVSPWEWRSQ